MEKRIFDLAKEIIESDIPWKEKYDQVFSDKINGRLKFPWCDPDMDYKDDVLAWWDAFQEYMENLPENPNTTAIEKLTDWQKNAAIHSMRYIFEDLNDEGWDKIAEITGLPLGVITQARENLFV